MPHATLIVEQDGPVLKVTMNRPEARNTLSGQMVGELIEVFERAREDDSVRVVVLAGAGGAFCAGGDLKDMGSSKNATSSDRAGGIAASNRRYGTLLEMIDTLPKAVIALVEGAAMGGGVGLVCVADWVIADKGTRMGMPEVTIGLVPAQIAPFVVARIGFTEARRLATFGGAFDGAAAQRLGFVHEVADGHADLITKGVAAVNQCLQAAPSSVAETKKLIRAALHEPLGALLDGAAQTFAAAIAGDAREGIRAFIEKRKPAWAASIEKL